MVPPPSQSCVAGAGGYGATFFGSLVTHDAHGRPFLRFLKIYVSDVLCCVCHTEESKSKKVYQVVYKRGFHRPNSCLSCKLSRGISWPILSFPALPPQVTERTLPRSISLLVAGVVVFVCVCFWCKGRRWGRRPRYSPGRPIDHISLGSPLSPCPVFSLDLDARPATFPAFAGAALRALPRADDFAGAARTGGATHPQRCG